MTRWGTRTVSWQRLTVPVQRRWDERTDRYGRPKPVYRNDVRCRLYWVFVLDPRTRYTTITLGYVGETSRVDPTVRFLEHLGDGTAEHPGQPWADTVPERDPARAIAGGLLVISDVVYDSKEEAWAAEEAVVRRDRPIYNYEYNLDNPHRVSIPDARAARAERDRVAGVPPELTWAALDEQHRMLRPGTAAGSSWRPSIAAGRLSAATVRRLGRLGGWAAATAGVWWVTAQYLPVASTLRLGLMSAILVAAAMLWWVRPRRGRWRRLGNRLARSLLLVVAVYIVVWPAAERMLA